jgi:hypothetical protein
MIPLLIILAIRTRPGARRWWLPIPLFVIWLLLLPLLLLLLPIAILVMLWIGMKPLRSLRLFWQLLTSLAGTRLDLDDGRFRLHLRVI